MCQPGLGNREPIQIRQLEDSIGREAVLEILKLFIGSTDTLLDNLENATDKQNAQSLKALAHELKGVCASLGINEMTRLSKQLEQIALQEDWSTAENLVKQIKEDFQSVTVFVNQTYRLE